MTEPTAEVHYLTSPQTLAEFHPDMIGKISGYKTAMLAFIHSRVYGTTEVSEYGRQLVRQYLCELPHLVEEVRALRPDLLEM